MIVFKSIKPATAFKSSTFRDEIRASATRMAPKILKDFQATTKSWEHQPEFKTEVNVGRAAGGYIATKAGTPAGAEISVTTDDEIYAYVDEGTKPHIIRAKNAPNLIFNYPFKAKTKPKILKSYKGSVGNKIASKKFVKHPGTEAREFSKTIHKKWQKDFRNEMDAAIKRAAKLSGHGMK